MSGCFHIPAPYTYRNPFNESDPQKLAQLCAAALQNEIEFQGQDTIAAMIMEPILGAGGVIPPHPSFAPMVREICDRHGVLLILDEVMCGMGRTGSLFACEQDGVTPDILCIAKGLGAGYQPIGAMLCSTEIYEAIEAGSGFFQHGHTYLGHPAACAGALAVIESIEQRQLIPRVNQVGARLRSALEEAFGQHPHIGDIRGRGLFLGLEIVENRETKAPFDPARAINKRFKAAAFEAGLICYPMGGTLDGKHGDHVLLAPPFIIEDQQIEEITNRLGIALEASLKA